MTRYLKAPGLALAAMLLFAAMGATAASAQGTPGHLTSPDTEVTLIGEETEGVNAFTAFGAEVVCPGGTFTWHKLESTPHLPLHSGETAATVTPHYDAHEACENEREVHMNGCDYEFYDFTTTGEIAGTYGFDIDISCPPEKEITMTGLLCVVHIPPQEGLTGLHATNEPGGVRITGKVVGITATLTCLGGHTENAVWHTDMLVEGFNEFEESSSISISH